MNTNYFTMNTLGNRTYYTLSFYCQKNPSVINKKGVTKMFTCNSPSLFPHRPLLPTGRDLWVVSQRRRHVRHNSYVTCLYPWVGRSSLGHELIFLLKRRFTSSVGVFMVDHESELGIIHSVSFRHHEPTQTCRS